MNYEIKLILQNQLVMMEALVRATSYPHVKEEIGTQIESTKELLEEAFKDYVERFKTQLLKPHYRDVMGTQKRLTTLRECFEQGLEIEEAYYKVFISASDRVEYASVDWKKNKKQ